MAKMMVATQRFAAEHTITAHTKPTPVPERLLMRTNVWLLFSNSFLQVRHRAARIWLLEVGDGFHQVALCRVISLMVKMETGQPTTTGMAMAKMMVDTHQFVLVALCTIMVFPKPTLAP